MFEAAICMYDFLRTGNCYYPNPILIDSQTGKVTNNRVSYQTCSYTDCSDKKVWKFLFSVKTLINENVSFKEILDQILKQAYNEELDILNIKKEDFDCTIEFFFIEVNKIKIFFDNASIPAPYVSQNGRVPLADDLLTPWQKNLKDNPIEITIADKDRLILWNMYSPFIK